MISFFQKYNKDRNYIITQIIIFFALINLFISDFNCRKDLSKENRFDLTDSTEKIINGLTEKLYIDAFYSEDVPGAHKARLTLAKEVLKEIASVNRKKVDLRFYNPDSSESARKKANEAGIRSFPLEKLERGSAEVKQAYFGIRLTLGAKSEVIPVAYAAENIEYQVLSTLKKMTRKPGSSNLALLKANGAHTATEPIMGFNPNKDTFSAVIHEVFAKEYGTPEEVNINEEPVPEEFNILLWVGAPDLNEKGNYHLDQFLMRGGGLIVLAKTMDFTLPSRQRGMPSFGGEGIATAHPNAEKVNQFLRKYGVEVKTDLIFEPEFSLVTNSFIQVQPGVFVPYHYPLWPVPTHDSKQLSKESLITKTSTVVFLPWTSGLEISADKQSEAKYDIVITSTKEADRQENYVMLGEEQVAMRKLTPVGINIPLAVHVHGKFKSAFTQETIPKDTKLSHIDKTKEGKTSQLFVLGTPYLISDMFITNQHIEIMQKANIPFFFNLVDIFSGDTDLISTRTKQAYIRNLKPISKTIQNIFSFVNIFFIPVGIAIYAFVRLKKRNSTK